MKLILNKQRGPKASSIHQRINFIPTKYTKYVYKRIKICLRRPPVPYQFLNACKRILHVAR